MNETLSAGASGASGSRWPTQRSLNEPVLESVEQELGAAEAQTSSASAQAQQLQSGPANGIDQSGQAWWLRMQQELSRRVSQRPAQSALLALGLGAALVIWLSRGARRPDKRG